MNVQLCVPDYSCVSKRSRAVKVACRQPSKGRITDVVINSTGLKVFGEGEWKVRKHGAEKRRVWRKWHLAVDPATHDFVAAEVSLENVHDAEVLPTLLNPLRRKLGTIYADGAYDSKASHQLIAHKGAAACIPPRKNAGQWKKGHPCAGDAQRRVGLLEEDIGISPSFVGGNSNVPVQAVNGRQNHAAKIQLSGGRGDDVYERNEQTEHPWTTCKKAPNVAVTWGWESHDLLADLGNNTYHLYRFRSICKVDRNITSQCHAELK